MTRTEDKLTVMLYRAVTAHAHCWLVCATDVHVTTARATLDRLVARYGLLAVWQDDTLRLLSGGGSIRVAVNRARGQNWAVALIDEETP